MREKQNYFLPVLVGIPGFLFIVSVFFIDIRISKINEESQWFKSKLRESMQSVTEVSLRLADWNYSPETNIERSIYESLESIKRSIEEQLQSPHLTLGKLENAEKEIHRVIRISHNEIEKVIESQQRWLSYRSLSHKRYRNNTPASTAEVERQLYFQFQRRVDGFKSSLTQVENVVMSRENSIIAYHKFLFYVLLAIGIIVIGVATLAVIQVAARITAKEKENRDILADNAYRQKILSEYVQKISDGDYTAEMQLDTRKNSFAKALVDLKEKLQKAASDGKLQKEEDNRRSWTTQGLTKFAEILRENSSSIYDLSYTIISSLVKYLNANQGGIFIINDTDPKRKFLELTGAYAFERRKTLSKSIEFGEGLVGMCILEGKTTYMTDIPEGYLNIQSGLGDSPPRSLLIVPLTLNEQYFGVVEIASFNQFKDHEIAFVEKVGENIAASLSNAKINERTSYLLKQSSSQSEMLKAQEEEMRQNLEEMQAIQETQEMTERKMRETEVMLKHKIKGLEMAKQQLERKRDEMLEKADEKTASLQLQLEQAKQSLHNERKSLNERISLLEAQLASNKNSGSANVL
jgi:putative methionine-R-sulfoxide reductase with GAF domain